MGYVVNSNVYGPVSDGAAVTNYHFGLRAEDYVVDSESDGAVRDTFVKLTGETDATNTALVVGSGDATGVVFVDATPAMNKETNSLGTGGGSIMINNDGSITLSFDQNVLDVVLLEDLGIDRKHGPTGIAEDVFDTVILERAQDDLGASHLIVFTRHAVFPSAFLVLGLITRFRA